MDLPSELQDLEDAIHHHQGLYEHITAAYSEVTAHYVHTLPVSPFLRLLRVLKVQCVIFGDLEEQRHQLAIF